MSNDFPPGPSDSRDRPSFSSADGGRPHDKRHGTYRSPSKPRGNDNNSFRKRAPESASLIIGWHPVLEALDAGKELQRVLIQRDEKSERTGALLQQLRDLDIPVQRVPREKLDRITQKNHQGLVAFLSPIVFQPLEELISRAYEAGESEIVMGNALKRLNKPRDSYCVSSKVMFGRIFWKRLLSKRRLTGSRLSCERVSDTG